jgi:ABC-type transport system involved in multi-copper enzyme maturation permease subunit
MNAVLAWQWKALALRPAGWLALLLATATCAASFVWLAALLSREQLIAIGAAGDPIAQFLGPNLFLIGLASVLVPLLTMNLFNNEQGRGNWDLLVASPVPTFRIVLGKFLAAWGWFFLCLSPWPVALLALRHWNGRFQYLAEWFPVPEGPGLAFDLGRAACGFAGLLVAGGAFVAVGVALSSLCKRPAPAALLTLIAMGVALALGALPSMLALWNVAPSAILCVEQWSAWKYVEKTSQGQLPVHETFRLLAFAVGCLLLACGCIRSSQRRKLAGAIVAIMALALAGPVCLPRQIDLSLRRLNSLAPETRALLARVNAPVEVIILEPRMPRTTGERAFVQAAALVRKLVELCASQNALVRCRTRDPADGALAGLLPERAAGVAAPAVVIAIGQPGGWRSEVLSLDDLVAIVPLQSSAAPAVEFRGEQLFAAALERLLDRRSSSVGYTLVGHAELDPEEHDQASPRGLGLLKASLASEGCDLRSLDLSAEPRVPADADFVLIAGPRVPLSAPIRQRLEEYLRHGGRALFLLDRVLDPLTREVAALGLNELLAEWGVRLGHDRVVGVNFAGVPDGQVAAVKAASDLALARSLPPMTLLLREACSVRVAPEERDPSVESLPLLMTDAAPRVWAETDLSTIEEPRFEAGKDLPGPICLAVAVQRRREETVEPVAIVLGNAEFASNAQLSGAGGHAALRFLSESLRWLRRKPASMADIPARQFPAFLQSATNLDLRGLAWKMGLIMLVVVVAAGAAVLTVRRAGWRG